MREHVSEKQKSFNADLRYPVIDRDGERWSLWKSLAMMELSARETYHFVKTMLPALAHKIVEVGCGDGYWHLSWPEMVMTCARIMPMIV
jgi:hypothetical protein